jgi:hypothetical protein
MNTFVLGVFMGKPVVVAAAQNFLRDFFHANSKCFSSKQMVRSLPSASIRLRQFISIQSPLPSPFSSRIPTEVSLG